MVILCNLFKIENDGGKLTHRKIAMDKKNKIFIILFIFLQKHTAKCKIVTITYNDILRSAKAGKLLNKQQLRFESQC